MAPARIPSLVSPRPRFRRRRSTAVSPSTVPWASSSRARRPRSPASSPIKSVKPLSRTRSVITASAAARSCRLAAAASTRSRASASISAASLSSITWKCGASPASSGKRRSSDWQKACRVSMRMPPGASRTLANRRRAVASTAGSPASAPSSVRSAASRPSSVTAHRARRRATRTAISADAALVKVRHSRRSGAVPASSRLSRRSMRTLVLPVPAEAATHTEVRGWAARRCSTSLIAVTH